MARPTVDNIDKEISYYPRGNTFGLKFWRPGDFKFTRLSLGKKVDEKGAILLRDQLKELRNCYKAHPNLEDPIYDNYDKNLTAMYFKLGRTGTSLVGKSEPIDSKTHWIKMGEKNERIKKLEDQLEEKDQTITDLQSEIELFKDHIHAKHAAIAKDMKSNKAVLVLYEAWMVSDDIDKSTMRNYLKRINSLLDANPGSIIDITHKDVTEWLIKFVAEKERKNSIETWNRARIWFTKFFTWSSTQWDFINPMPKVQIKINKDYHDIEWHELDELEKMIADIKNVKDIDLVYWQALIGVMAYAGLSQHEARALQTKNIDLDKLTLRVTPSKEANVKLKNKKRVRSIEINEHLKPLLISYIKSGHPGKYLFPNIYTYQKGKPPWNNRTGLSVALHGKGIRATILPEYLGEIKCSCLSLRRSFGSILIRSGCTAAEVAAAMGNSIAIVEKHYARILAKEVRTSLKPI